MKTILALQGPENKGKTSSLVILRNLMLVATSGYIQVPGKYWKDPSSDDFIDIFEKAGKYVGIASAGDIPSIITRNLNGLQTQNCEIIVTSCRTMQYVHGRNTVAAIEAFIAYYRLYKLKQIDPLPVLPANKLTNPFNIGDANELITIINQLIK